MLGWIYCCFAERGKPWNRTRQRPQNPRCMPRNRNQRQHPPPTHTPRPTVPPERDTAKEEHSTIYSYPTPRRSTPTPKKSTVTTDPYDIHDYSDPEEFYYYNYDDFYDYYDAEEYYNEYMY